MTTASSGLGRGLAAILTGPSLPDQQTTIRSKFVDSALSSLTKDQGLSLCGYVHDHAGEVSVTLRTPELRSLHPTQAYQLFTALGDISSSTRRRHNIRFSGLQACGVIAQVPDRSGLLFFGDTQLDQAAINRLAAFCQVYLPVILEHDRAADNDERLHLVLDQEGGAVHAEVSVLDRQGFGSAPRTDLAAAQAALSAFCEGAKLVDVGIVRAGDGAASFVVAAGELGRMAMGAAPVVEGPDAAAAVAAVRAAKHLI